MRAFLVSLGVLLGLALLGAAAFTYSGVYDVAAADPHWDVTARVLEQLRVRPLERRARQVTQVPNLEDKQLISRGGRPACGRAATWHPECGRTS